MCSYFIDGKKFASLESIHDVQLRMRLHRRIERHEAYSYRGDWYASLEDLDDAGRLACIKAASKVRAKGVDLRSIPRVAAVHISRFGTPEHQLRLNCAFNAINEHGKLDCDEAAKQFVSPDLNALVSPVSFLRKLNELPKEIDAAWHRLVRETMGFNPSDLSVAGGKPAYVRWDGKPLKNQEQAKDGENGKAEEKGKEGRKDSTYENLEEESNEESADGESADPETVDGANADEEKYRQQSGDGDKGEEENVEETVEADDTGEVPSEKESGQEVKDFGEEEASDDDEPLY